MNANRLEMLRKFVEEDPADPFNRYALALELLGVDPAQAEHQFRQLLIEHPHYLPAYYQTANLLLQQKQSSQAIDILSKGIALARTQANRKTEAELQFLLDDLQD